MQILLLRSARGPAGAVPGGDACADKLWAGQHHSQEQRTTAAAAVPGAMVNLPAGLLQIATQCATEVQDDSVVVEFMPRVKRVL